jgi:hypothetical protein
MSESTISFPTKKKKKTTKQKQQQNLLPKAEQTKEHAQTGAMALTKSWVADPYINKKKKRISKEEGEESVARTRFPPP